MQGMSDDKRIGDDIDQTIAVLRAAGFEVDLVDGSYRVNGRIAGNAVCLAMGDHVSLGCFRVGFELGRAHERGKRTDAT